MAKVRLQTMVQEKESTKIRLLAGKSNRSVSNFIRDILVEKVAGEEDAQ